MLAAGGSLSACRKAGVSDPLKVSAASDAGSMDRKFGKGFGRAFHADPNAPPRNVSDGDVTPVSLTTEPINIE